MADDTSTTDSTETDDAATATTGGEELPEGARNALTAARREARQADRARKAAEARVAEFENRDKTESQKLTERAEAAEKAAADATAKLLRYSIAAEKKLPPALAARLQGGTEDELRADADELLKLLPASAAPSFDGGARTTADTPQDMNSLIRRAAGRG